jgi:hypothetical protein
MMAGAGFPAAAFVVEPNFWLRTQDMIAKVLKLR